MNRGSLIVLSFAWFLMACMDAQVSRVLKSESSTPPPISHAFSGSSVIQQEAAAERSEDCIPPAQCCKICSRGQACGNSCISRAYTCHQGPGCACDAAEVCR